LSRQNFPVTHGYANIDGSVDNMDVSDGISVGGDDHAAAQAVFHPVLRLRRAIELTAELMAERTARTKKLLHVGHAFQTALLLAGLRCHCNIDHRRCNSCRQRFHCAVEREQCSDTIIVKRGRCRSRHRCLCRLRKVEGRHCPNCHYGNQSHCQTPCHHCLATCFTTV